MAESLQVCRCRGLHQRSCSGTVGAVGNLLLQRASEYTRNSHEEAKSEATTAKESCYALQDATVSSELDVGKMSVCLSQNRL